MLTVYNLPAPAPGGGGSERAAFVAQQRGRAAVLYVARVTGAGSTFYAAGITYALFSLLGRLKRKTYAVQVVAQYSSQDAGAVFDVARALATEFWGQAFRPEPAFVAGHVPCYESTAPLLPWLEQQAGAVGVARSRVGIGWAAWVAKQHDRKAILYVVKLYNPEETFYKIGATFDLPARLSRLRGAYKWRTVAKFSSYNAGAVWDLEQKIHACFAHLRYVPNEDFGGDTECYSAVEEILAVLPEKTFFLKNTETLI